MITLVCWPKNCDYPLWRQQNPDAYVALTGKSPTYDYSGFVSSHYKTIDAGEYDGDWRNFALTQALKWIKPKHETIWFTEQDFLVKTLKFWDVVNEVIGKGFTLAHFQGDRLHPCCLFIPYSVLKKTSMNFGVIKDKGDHFSRIQRDLDRLGVPVTSLTDIGLVEGTDFEHLNGLSQNHALIERGEAPNHQVKRFNEYLQECLDSGVELQPYWKQETERYLIHL